MRENASFVASLFGVGFFQRRRRIRELLKFLELWEARDRLARDISGGMQRRLQLACALVHRPRLLFVDEPTSGLDPVLRQKIWEHLRTLRDQGTSIFVTTQYIDEAENCDQVAVMAEGQVIAVGTPDDLRARALGGEELDIEASVLRREDVVAIWQVPGVQAVHRYGPNVLRVTVDSVSTVLPAVTEALQARGTPLNAVHPYMPGFDEVVMKLVTDHQDGHRP